MPGQTPPTGLLDSPGLVTKSNGIPLGTENHLAMQLAIDTFTRMQPQVTLINLPEFDRPLGHVNGGSLAPSEVTTLMQSFDRDLALLQDAYRRVGVLDRTAFILMADHGMMPPRHTVDSAALEFAITSSGTQVVTESFSLFYSQATGTSGQEEPEVLGGMTAGPMQGDGIQTLSDPAPDLA